MRQVATDETDMFNLDVALNLKIGCGCRIRPLPKGASMVLEVVDRTVANTVSIYAIRAAIPPAVLADEIHKTQRAFASASKTTDPEKLDESIPIISPKSNIVPNIPIPAVGRFPLE